MAVNLVLVDATVKTKDGQIMANLKKDDFEVREDGVAQKLEVFSRDELPLNVALVLDLSDSIGPFLGPLRDAATIALAALKPEDEVALFTFSTEAELRLPLTKDKNKIADQINTFEARGATNINDGIFVAAEYLLKTPPNGRRVIILISDDVGTSAGGQGTRDIVTEAIAADAVLYNLKIPGYNPPSTIFAREHDSWTGEHSQSDGRDGRGTLRRPGRGAPGFRIQRSDSADQDALHIGILHDGQRRRGKTAQAGCSSGVLVWKKRARLLHLGQKRVLRSLGNAEHTRLKSLQIYCRAI